MAVAITSEAKKICDKFKGRASITWGWLAKNRLYDYQLKEETITDIHILKLREELDGLMITKDFTRNEEGKNGADWEWWFTTNSFQEWFGIRVQAKIINVFENRFKQLHYKNQIYNLIKACSISGETPRLPIYCLYTHWQSRPLGLPVAAIDDRQYGCSLMSIESVLHLKPHELCSLEDIAPYIFPWHELVCLDQDLIYGSFPDVLRMRLIEKLLTNRPAHQGQRSEEPSLEKLLPPYLQTPVIKRPPQYVVDHLIQLQLPGASQMRVRAVSDGALNRQKSSPDPQLRGFTVLSDIPYRS